MPTKTYILLIDDDASLRETLRACLETAGYLCVEAKNGDAARAWLEEGHLVNLIVTDHQMPGVSGLEFVKGFRSDLKAKAIPIVFYSGQVTIDLKVQALQAGVSAVLEKPFPLQEFLDLVGRLCKESVKAL